MPAEGAKTEKTDLYGRVALVTHAALGVGRATALQLAEAGATVVINYRHRKDEALATVAEITSMNGRAIAVGADVSKGSAVDTMMHQIHAHFGRVDLLVNNAITLTAAEAANQTKEEFDRVVAANLKAAFLCMQAVLPGMRQRRWGRVVNICPAGIHQAVQTDTDEVSARAGIAELTRAYGAQLTKEGITVNAIAPSMTNSGGPQNPPDNFMKDLALARLETPLEIAQAAVMVLGNAYLTGQVIYAFGARSQVPDARQHAGAALHVN